MDYPKEILVKDYFEIHNYYSNIYGLNRTIILMQVGSFHECYSTDNDGLNLIDLAQQLDVVCTRKNGNNPLSKANPRMMGFPTSVTRNFIDKLIDLNYTIVLIDQVTEPPAPKRKVVGIYSPATYIEKNTNKTSYLVSIVIDMKGCNIVIGLSSYDLTTGQGSFYETYSQPNDISCCLDNSIRYLEKYPPREIILEISNNMENNTINNMNINDIVKYMGIDSKSVYNMKIVNHKKIAYQKSLLERIYNCDNNVIELLDLQFLNWARYSLVLLLDYVQSHQQALLTKLSLPSLYITDRYLYLGNRAIDQLNVINKNSQKSLFDIINYTKTTIGKRYLKSQLSSPLINNTEISCRYNNIERIILGKHYVSIGSYLEDIYDLEKLIRKLEISIIQPYELYHLYLSFYQVKKLFEYMEDNKLLKHFDIKNTNINQYLNHITELFDITKITELNFNNYHETSINIYNKTKHPQLDLIQDNISIAENFMTHLIKSLEDIMNNNDDVIFKKKIDNDVKLITLKFNERDGHYLLMTSRRCDLLRKSLTSHKTINIGNYSINSSDLIFTALPKTTNTKINCKKIQEISNELTGLRQNMAKQIKTAFISDIKNISDHFSTELLLISERIAFIDFINSGSIAATTNHYTKPTIIHKDYSFFNSKEMRHPIMEKISNTNRYVPHDIDMNGDGILLYGINSSGKSTLMKSIGLNIILAQIGYYTATSSFEYCPYHSIFTRISGDDNMYMGQSSFMVEMMELMAILKRNNKNTLVVADEIARGSEIRSATVIVSYMIERLTATKSSFITASHLHQVANLSCVKNNKSVRVKHLKITYDSNNDMLIFDRMLLDGMGETFYGLMVAKYMMKDKHFNERTSDILNEYDNTSSKVCKYNSNMYLHECYICKSKQDLESHHIIWQKEFDSNGYHNKIYLKKDDQSNLVTLCRSCHDMVDRNEIDIKGWIETSNGRMLDYNMNKETLKKTKYTPEFIKYIQSLKDNDVKMAKIMIKEKYNVKVSSNSIIKYLN